MTFIKKSILSLMVGAFLGLIVGCVTEVLTMTPQVSEPQMTAIILNQTYEAQATETALAPTLTATPSPTETDTPTPTLTLTWSICPELPTLGPETYGPVEITQCP